MRKEVVPNTESYDVAVTTYEMACNPLNATLTQKVYWRCLVLDEGHRVKNEETAAHQVLKRIKRQHTLLLTGTPIQNNLHELYAILSFLHPDIFTPSEPFDKAFNLNTSEHKVDSDLLEKAHFLMRPFILRRVKGEVEVFFRRRRRRRLCVRCPRRRRSGTEDSCCAKRWRSNRSRKRRRAKAAPITFKSLIHC